MPVPDAKSVRKIVPGTASCLPVPDATSLRKMNKKQLRVLAARTAGVRRDKKNSKGKWVHKTNKEILESLLAVGVNSQTQVLPVPDALAQRLAGIINKRPAARSSSFVLMRKLGTHCAITRAKKAMTQVPVDPDAQAQRPAGDIKKRPAARSSSSVLMRRLCS